MKLGCFQYLVVATTLIFSANHGDQDMGFPEAGVIFDDDLTRVDAKPHFEDWLEASKAPRMARITADGTWTVPDGITQIELWLYSGGGGGGGASESTVTDGSAGDHGDDSTYEVNSDGEVTVLGGQGGGGGRAAGQGGSINTSGLSRPQFGVSYGQIGGGYGVPARGGIPSATPYELGTGGKGGDADSGDVDGGAGASGGYNFVHELIAVDPGDVLTFVIGAGGAGGAGGGAGGDGTAGQNGCAIIRW